MSVFRSLWLCVTSVVAAISLLPCSNSRAEDPILFNRDIRPILSDYCFACHGPDAEHRAGDLRLDQREAAVESKAVVPHQPESSLIIQRIFSTSSDEQMPPPDSGKVLTDQQKQLLQRWIAAGAEYQKHWSFEPIPQSVPVPHIGSDWARNPIDNFVAAEFEKRHFSPSPAADKSTWLRRVTFDLTGLPPSLEELQSFLTDEANDAYERVVDRLLRSQAYGERMANMWMDVARYADTFGYQADVEMQVWPWRDWLIAAFNRNLPYDQFVVEQVAGDLLPNATQDQRLATAFSRLHRQTNEGGSIPEEFRLAGIADRTTTAGTAFLGLTFECSRCHDHKFDPITMRDFYSLSAYFSDIDEFGVYSHFTHTAPTPALLLYEGDQRQQHEQALQAVVAAKCEYDRLEMESMAHWLQHRDALIQHYPSVRQPVYTNALDGTADGPTGKATTCDGDNEIKCEGVPEFGRNSPFSFSLWVKPAIQQPRMIVIHQSVAAEDAAFRGWQLNIDDGQPQFSMIHFWPGNAVRVQALDRIPVGQWSHLAVTHDGSGTAAGIKIYVNGQLQAVTVIRDQLTRDIRYRREWGDSNAGSVKLALGARFRDVGFRDGQVDQLDLFDVELSGAEINSLMRPYAALESQPELSEENALHHQLLVVDKSLRAAREQLLVARQAENEMVTGVRQIMAMQHSKYAPATHILQRGDYTAKQDVVFPATPAFLNVLPAGADNRLALARWLVDPQNPLTARVVANRYWHLFFGRGIASTLEDLGSQGAPPSHPELLDYLARFLIDQQWDLHALCRHIVLSATYRQSSTAIDSAAYQLDPENIWLARGPKHRLSAEQLRDAVLAASGLLVRKIGGPSVMPYQPAGLWEEAGTGKSYHQSTGEGLYRRSLYTFWRRTAPPPSMLTFDATSRENCTARRELTTTPLQALVFLNDPQYVEAARVTSENLIARHGDDLQQRWHELFLLLISRPPTDAELAIVADLYAEQLKTFTADPTLATELLAVGNRPARSDLNSSDLAATTAVVQMLIAYDETIMLR